MFIGILGIPHLAKNERDMGHPLIRGRDRIGPAGSHADSKAETLLAVGGTTLKSCPDTKRSRGICVSADRLGNVFRESVG
jgi:hypothetical protein